jgi:hypothetical protein
MTQKNAVNQVMIAKARSLFASSLDKLGTGVTKLTAMEGGQGVTPEQVSQILSEEVLPALEGVKNTIEQIDGALPQADALGTSDPALGEGDPDMGADPGMGGDEEEELLGAKATELQTRIASLEKENLGMKMKNYAKQYASAFPPHMRQAMEDSFCKDHEEDMGTDKMEAKVASVQSILNAYKTAGLINKTRLPGGITQTAKQSEAKGKSTVPWNMR